MASRMYEVHPRPPPRPTAGTPPPRDRSAAGSAVGPGSRADPAPRGSDTAPRAPAEPGLVPLPAPAGGRWDRLPRSGPPRAQARRPGPGGRPTGPMAWAQPVADGPDRTDGSATVSRPWSDGGDRRLAGRSDRHRGGRSGGRGAGPALSPVRRPGSLVAAGGHADVAVAVAFWPVLGRTGEQWLPLASRWAGPPRVTVDSSPRAPAGVIGPPSNVRRTDRRRTGYAVAPGDPGGAEGRANRSVFGGRALQGLPSVRVHRRDRRGDRRPVPHRHRSARRAGPQLRPPRPGRPGHPDRRRGPGSCRPWPGKDPTSTGSSGSSPACLTTAARCASTGPTTPCSESTRRPAAPTGSLVDESAPVTRRHRVLLALSIHTSPSSRSDPVRRAAAWSGSGRC